jgi:hypothetical protein
MKAGARSKICRQDKRGRRVAWLAKKFEAGGLLVGLETVSVTVVNKER